MEAAARRRRWYVLGVLLERQPARVRQALEELRAGVVARYGDAVVELKLFGSCARGEADAASDVDVLVVLDHVEWKDHVAVIDLAADIGLSHDLLLRPTVFDRSTWERWHAQQRPLVVEIEREGIRL